MGSIASLPMRHWQHPMSGRQGLSQAMQSQVMQRTIPVLRRLEHNSLSGQKQVHTCL